MKMTFSEVSKHYNIPRSSVYSVFNKLQKENPDMYNKFISSVQDRQVIDSNGIQYLLDTRRSSNDYIVQDRQVLDSSLDNELDADFKKENDLISYFKKELEDKKKEYNDLYENHAKLVVSMQKSNENLYELTKNQQILQRELQQLKKIEFKIETPLDTDKTTFRQDSVQSETRDLAEKLAEMELENLTLLSRIDSLENSKKGFWMRVFGK